MLLSSPFLFFFFFNDTATTEIYTLSLHDALPISGFFFTPGAEEGTTNIFAGYMLLSMRSEEHTSELQPPCNLVCRLLLEKKKSPVPAGAGSGAPEVTMLRRRLPCV